MAAFSYDVFPAEVRAQDDRPMQTRMKHRILTVLFAIGSATTAACSRDTGDPASGGLTVGEAEQLDAAAARLDARPQSPAAGDSALLEREIEAGIKQEAIEQQAR
jgi:hypothetical protein